MTIALPGGAEAYGIAANQDGCLGVGPRNNDTVYRINPDNDQVEGSPFRRRRKPRNVSATEDAVWVANADDDTVSRIDVDQ